jgi:uncharacterized repeat protein (TIGR01451 family)
MGKIIRFLLLALIIVVVLYACTLMRATPDNSATTLSGDVVPALSLAKQAVNGTAVFNTVGQVINYSYVVTNIASAALAGPVTITDDKAIVACPDLNTVGNLDNNLDQNENITCISAYSITQADLNAGSVTNNATAKAGGIDSNTATIVVKMTENKVLTLTKSANPTSYNQVGQTITYTYVIKNTGAPTLGPAQFIVRDDRIPTPVNCGAATATLATNETLTCTAVYTIAQADMAANQIINTATASGGGAGVGQPATSTITNTNVQPIPGTPSTLPRGTTIQHKVVKDEWLIQIGRCYGADFTALRNANPGIIDPDFILPDTIVTVPNIGSNGKIYGPPCVGYHTVVSGDTWNSIAQKYNADVLVLQEANKDVALTPGVKLKVPLNSAGTTTPLPPTNEAIRLNFSAAAPTVTVQGNVNGLTKVRYVFTAAQGQTLTVKVTGPANELALGIYTSSSTAVKAQDTTLTYTGTIPANGDYFIEVVGILASTIKAYTLEASLVTPTPVSQVQRVADINAGAGDSSPAYLTIFNNALYFKAEGSDGAGAELWKYDTGLQGVNRAADVNLGAGGSNPAFLATFNGALYFRANGNDGAGTELWRYDGNSPGRMPDIHTAGDSNPAYMTVFNNTLYFSANGNDGTGIELWKTDGTTVSRAIDIYTGTGDSNPAHLAVFNNALYFSATSNDGFGTELWKYDGTTATRVTDINAGVGNSNPSYLALFNNALYFGATSSDGTGNELWKFDGTTASRAADIHVGAGDSVPSYLTLFGGALYFSANGNDATGFELWKFDGTTASRVIDINKAGDSSPAFFAVVNNELFFQANGGDGAGRELWKYKLP